MSIKKSQLYHSNFSQVQTIRNIDFSKKIDDRLQLDKFQFMR